MDFKTIQPDISISLFVKNILVFEEQEKTKNTTLPFFADGCPGLMFQNTENGLFVQPHNKKMPCLFLYGQTINPIELEINGRYKLIVFQLYPFILKSFFSISAIDINDSCYDLQQVDDGENTIKKLSETKQVEKRIEIITNFLFAIFKAKQKTLDFAIKQAIQLILDNKGQISIKKVCEKTHLTKRTFERRFLNETGISPKQFSKIIQFHQSLEQMT
ncbi:MAG: DUF6597 domain-containing transcriptional factor [Chitinophagaceae bacterium]